MQLLGVPWAVARQAPPSVGFSRQERSSGSLCPSRGDHPDTGIEPRSPALQADSLSSEPPGNEHSPQSCGNPASEMDEDTAKGLASRCVVAFSRKEGE